MKDVKAPLARYHLSASALPQASLFFTLPLNFWYNSYRHPVRIHPNTDDINTDMHHDIRSTRYFLLSVQEFPTFAPSHCYYAPVNKTIAPMKSI